MSARRLVRVAGWLLLFGMLALLSRSIPWADVATAAAMASPYWLLLAVLAHATILPFGAWQWMYLVPNGEAVSFRTMLWIRSVGWAVANGGPFMAEHAASVHLLARRGGVGYAGGTSIKLLDQVTGGLSKVIVLGVTLVVVPLPRGLGVTAAGLVLGFAALWAVLLVGAHGGHRLEGWAARGGARTRAVVGFLARVATRLETIRRPGSSGGGLLFALLQRAAEGAACWAVVTALGETISLPGVLLVVTAINLSTMLSLTPANLGVYEGSALLALTSVGMPADHALATAVLLHLSYLVPVAGTGWLLLARNAWTGNRGAPGTERMPRRTNPR